MLDEVQTKSALPCKALGAIAGPGHRNLPNLEYCSVPIQRPPLLRAGDKVRFVSPASPPDEAEVMLRAKKLESWGLEVNFGQHVFKKLSYLAGTDDERLADLNSAFQDPEVKAIFTTRGGKGSYRIASRIDFDAVRANPKFLIGFSDITILHLCLWKHCRVVGIHGALYNAAGPIGAENEEALRRVLMTAEAIVVRARDAEATSALTTTGIATGRLIGGNLNMIATAAGWALPNLEGAILLIEDIGKWPGEIDRHLTMLREAGHLAGLAGVAVGQFTNFEFDIVELLRDHLDRLNVPILGGLPLGHGAEPHSVPIGAMATIDAGAQTLTISARSVQRNARLHRVIPAPSRYAITPSPSPKRGGHPEVCHWSGEGRRLRVESRSTLGRLRGTALGTLRSLCEELAGTV